MDPFSPLRFPFRSFALRPYCHLSFFLWSFFEVCHVINLCFYWILFPLGLFPPWSSIVHRRLWPTAASQGRPDVYIALVTPPLSSLSLSLKHCPALTFFDISQFHIPWDISLTSHFGHSIFWYTRKSAAFGHIFPRICCRHSRAVSWHLLAHSSMYPSSRICCRHPLQPGLTASVSWEVMGRRWPAHVAQARYHGNNPTSWNAFAKKKLAKLTRLTV